MKLFRYFPFFLSSALATALAHASPVTKYTFTSKTSNEDGTVTYVEPLVVSGQSSYSINVKEQGASIFNRVCIALGYDGAIPGGGVNSTAYNSSSYWTLASIDSNGSFVGTVPSDLRLSKVTCWIAATSNGMITGKFYENEDATVTIENVRLKIGDSTTSINVKQRSEAWTGACRLLGFDQNVPGDGLNMTNYNSSSNWANIAQLNANGDYVGTVATDLVMTKITCSGGIGGAYWLAPNFRLNSLEKSFEHLSHYLYPYQKQFLDELTRALKEHECGAICTAQDAFDLKARYFLLNAVSPFIHSLTMEWVRTNVFPKFDQMLIASADMVQEKDMASVESTKAVRRMALTILHAAFVTAKGQLGQDVHRQALEKLDSSLGIALASSLRDSDLDVFLDLYSKINPSNQLNSPIEAMKSGPRTKGIGLTVETVIQYLNAQLGR